MMIGVSANSRYSSLGLDDLRDFPTREAGHDVIEDDKVRLEALHQL
jgi:hypothetical protein